MDMVKKYVEVVARFHPELGIEPMILYWEGEEFCIDKVLDVRPAASQKVGGFGTRYTVRIAGALKQLWLEENRWFIEYLV